MVGQLLVNREQLCLLKLLVVRWKLLKARLDGSPIRVDVQEREVTLLTAPAVVLVVVTTASPVAWWARAACRGLTSPTVGSVVCGQLHRLTKLAGQQLGQARLDLGELLLNRREAVCLSGS